MDKFDLKDKVYCIKNRQVVSGIIVGTQNTQLDIEEKPASPTRYLLDFVDSTFDHTYSGLAEIFISNLSHVYGENEIFATKQELLDSL